MDIFVLILETGLALTSIGLVAVLVYIVVTLLHFKTVAVGSAKRLYERPTNSVKNLIATGKGIALQEQVRVQHMAGAVRTTGNGVKETATEVKDAVQSIHPEDLKAAVNNIQQVFEFVSVFVKFARATANQGAARPDV